ncbi:MAG: AmmeMemoRadiSam system protein B [Candidatus Omnitrophica bacterium]|nr:AmmeMemoRadiSam system protein B [Candidatus Omnitrophota bacterium]
MTRAPLRRTAGRSGPCWRTVGAWVVTGSLWFWAPGAVVAEPRLPKVAGQFYPADSGELRRVVEDFLARQPQPITTQKPRLLLVPHAGYQYSGPVAARGYRQLQGQHYDAVVIVAFTHQMPFEGSSVDTREAYHTPLGTLPVEQEVVARLQAYPGIGHVEAAHESAEHSLEVQLPFLQVALGQVPIIPILMGSARLDDARQLADALAALAKLGDYLFLFSTDLSHYHPSSEAESIDEGTVNAILFETPQAMERLFQGGIVEACGRGPILTSLVLAQRLGYPRRELLTYANSGQTAGDTSRVVGYASVAMFDRPASSTDDLSPEAGSALVAAARQAIERSFGRSASGAASPSGDSTPHRPVSESEQAGLDRYPELSRASGLFVTLRKRGQLRGCIGRMMTDEPLRTAIASVAVDAAQRDSRFAPVRAEELPEIRVEVSVLTRPAPLRDLTELVAGRDGVMLASQGRTGVFLPQVWEETGWTRSELLRELASQKAGLPPDAWQRASLSVFQDQIFEEDRVRQLDEASPPAPGRAH